MDERSDGLIIRTRPLTETSLVAHWLTPELGRIATVAKGARRAKSKFRGRLDLMQQAKFSFRRSRRSELHTLTEIEQLRRHDSMRKDVTSLRLMAYATRLVEQTTETENPLLGTYVIFTTLLEHLATARTRPALVYALEMKLLNELGLSPALSESKLDDSTINLLEQLAVRNWNEINSMKPNKSQVKAMKEYLHGFLIYHLGKLPLGREALLAG